MNKMDSASSADMMMMTREESLKDILQDRLEDAERRMAIAKSHYEDKQQLIKQSNEDITRAKIEIKAAQDQVKAWKLELPGKKEILAMRTNEVKVLKDAIKKL